MAVERSFGLLKGRFRSLRHCLAITKTEDVAEFIMACCVLHNVCIMNGDDLLIALEERNDEAEIINGAGVLVCAAAASNERDQLCATLVMRDA